MGRSARIEFKIGQTKPRRPSLASWSHDIGQRRRTDRFGDDSAIGEVTSASEGIPEITLRIAPRAVAQEISIVVDQAKVGTINEALQSSTERIDLPQVDSFWQCESNNKDKSRTSNLEARL